MIRKYTFGTPLSTDAVVLSLPAETGPVPFLAVSRDGDRVVLTRKLQPEDCLMCMLPLLAQQKLSLFGIANKWDADKVYSFNNTEREHMFDEMVMSFAQEYDANPMLHALLAQFSGDSENIDIPVAEFKLDEKNNYDPD